MWESWVIVHCRKEAGAGRDAAGRKSRRRPSRKTTAVHAVQIIVTCTGEFWLWWWPRNEVEVEVYPGARKSPARSCIWEPVIPPPRTTFSLQWVTYIDAFRFRRICVLRCVSWVWEIQFINQSHRNWHHFFVTNVDDCTTYICGQMCDWNWLICVWMSGKCLRLGRMRDTQVASLAPVTFVDFHSWKLLRTQHTGLWSNKSRKGTTSAQS